MGTRGTLSSSSSPSIPVLTNSSSPAMLLQMAPPSPVITALGVSTIKHHVPVTLSFKTSNFSKWKTYFTAACGKFGLLSYIDGTTEANPDDAEWAQADSCIRTWLYTSMAEDVSDMAVEPNQTARDLWVRTCSLFDAIRDTHAVFLRRQFHSMVQGDLTISKYFHRLKATANALHDVGRRIEDHELVLNALRGLNPRFKSAADIITFTSPLPDFARTRDMLLLKLSSESRAVDTSTATALMSASAGSCSGGTAYALAASCAPSPSAGHDCSKGRGRGHGNTTGGGFYSNPSRPPAPVPAHSTPTPPAGPWVCMTLLPGCPRPYLAQLRSQRSRTPRSTPRTGSC